MNLKKLNIIIIMLFCLTTVFAEVKIDIVGKIEDYKVYSEEVTFIKNCADIIYFNLPNGATNVHYENGSKINNLDNLIISNCNNTKLSYDLNIIEKISTENRIERKFLNLNNFNYTYSIEMPTYYIFDENASIPKNYSINYSSENKIIKFQSSEVYLIYYVATEPEKNSFAVEKFIEELKEPTVLIYIVIFFLLGFIVAYKLYVKNTALILSKHVPSYILSKEEKSILEVIEKNPGINQKLIGNELNFSKARVSAFVNDLEQKGLIRRERFGRSFKVYLDKKII